MAIYTYNKIKNELSASPKKDNSKLSHIVNEPELIDFIEHEMHGLSQLEGTIKRLEILHKGNPEIKPTAQTNFKLSSR